MHDTREHGNTDRAVKVLLLYLAFEYIRFQNSLLPFLSPLKIPMLIILFLAVLVFKDKAKIQFDKVVICSLLFVVEAVLWIPFATNNYYAFNTANSMFMIFVSMLAVVVFIDSKERVSLLFKAWIIINSVVACWVLTHGGKGPGGFVLDENDVCLVLVSAIPFSWYKFYESKGKLKYLYALSMVLMMVGVVVTSSRGGFLGLVAVFMVIIWYSRSRWRNIFTIIFVGLFAGSILLQVLPDSYVKDMQSISDKDDGTRNLRFLHWTTAWEIYKDNPVFGVGPNNYPWVSHNYFHLSPLYDPNARNRSGRQSHSLYFTLIPEMGTFGIVLFFTIIFHIYFRLSRVRELGGEAGNNACALLASLAGILVSGTFITILYYPVVWHMFAFSAAAAKADYD